MMVVYNENEKVAEAKENASRFKKHLHLKTIGFSIFAAVMLLLSLFVINSDSEGLLTPNSLKANAYKTLTPGTSWQWQITGNIDETVLDNVNNTKKMYDIDLFETDITTINRLKSKNIAVICYFSAGSSENWRPDYNRFPNSVKGNSNGWSGEKWLDVRNLDVLGPIMEDRLDLAKAKGCDGVEPDNVDGYTNNTGFSLSANDQLNYNKFLANAAHQRNLSVGLKNDVDQISQLEPYFDWALNEQCYQYNECGGYSAFINKGKAVFGVEYKGSTDVFCPKANNSNYDFLKKSLDLGAYPREACREGNGDSTVPPETNPTTCTSFTYSQWDDCQPNNTQSRTVISSSPGGCTGGSPETTRSCTYTSRCYEEGSCIPSEPTPTTCTSFTYSPWGICQPNNTQSRTVTSSSPEGCTGGSSETTRSCTYISEPEPVPESTKDTIAPTVQITKPQGESQIKWYRRLVVKAIAKDNVQIAKMEVYLDGELKKSKEKDDDEESIRWRLSWWKTRRLSKGVHTITVKAYDTSGNISYDEIVIYR